MTSDANQPSGHSEPPPEANPADPATPDAPEASTQPRRKILIGSQRDPDAYKPKPKRDWVSPRKAKNKQRDAEATAGNGPREDKAPPPTEAATLQPSVSVATEIAPVAEVAEVVKDSTGFPAMSIVAAPQQDIPSVADTFQAPAALSVEAVSVEGDAVQGEMDSAAAEGAFADTALAVPASPGAPGKKIPPPNIRGALSADLEQEFQAAFADVPLDTLMSGSEVVGAQAPLEPESRHMARVVAVGREDVFLELGGRDQAVIPLKVFSEPPQPGATFEIVIVRYNQEDGVYEATLPLAAAEIGDWSQIAEGMLVEARITGHNTGGLECEVNRLRGFIPVSQIALYRVENLEEYVGQKLTCLVTEANPHRRNLVLSRRAVLEREREEARRAILESLAPGQIREGVVRKILDFGAFVDLGSGVDGLLHVSQLGWGRVKHPSEVVQEGQKIRVRVDKVDPASKKISLSYKDLLDNPWKDADRKYAPNMVVRGKVVKIMEFGAFVELEPGVEGLVHISELSHKRVARVSDVVKEGDEIEVSVLSVDPKAQRISLSMKNVSPPPEPDAPPAAPEPAKPKPARQPAQPLLGGLGRSPKGAKFGLKW